MEEHSCSRSFSFAEIDLECRHPSPVSILEPSFESASCSNTNGKIVAPLLRFFLLHSLDFPTDGKAGDL